METMSYVRNIVEKQLNDHKPLFVEEAFFALQRKGCNRKQARTVIASVLGEEMYDPSTGDGEYDLEKYEEALNERIEELKSIKSIKDVILDIEYEIKDIIVDISNAMVKRNEEIITGLFCPIWPDTKEYIIHNMYRDTDDGIEKPDIADVYEKTEYNMNFEFVLSDIAMLLCKEERYEDAIKFSKEMLELFGWQRTSPDPYKDDIGHALSDMGNREESDKWYQNWLAKEPGNLVCVNGYAFSHQKRDDIKGALAIVEPHLPGDGSVEYKYKDIYTRAASLYVEIGDYSKAIYYRSLVDEICEKHENYFDKYDLPLSLMPLVKGKKLYPNDPCPCGSGMKYKKCCGRNN